MSCTDCERVDVESWIAWYRWGKANVGLIACDKHTREIFDALNAAQDTRETEVIGDGEE